MLPENDSDSIQQQSVITYCHTWQISPLPRSTFLRYKNGSNRIKEFVSLISFRGRIIRANAAKLKIKPGATTQHRNHLKLITFSIQQSCATQM